MFVLNIEREKGILHSPGANMRSFLAECGLLALFLPHPAKTETGRRTNKKNLRDKKKKKDNSNRKTSSLQSLHSFIFCNCFLLSGLQQVYRLPLNLCVSGENTTETVYLVIIWALTHLY